MNPAYLLDKQRKTSFTCKLGDAVLDPICALTTHRFEALYETRCLAAAALNLRKVTFDQLTEFQHLLRMDIQYLAGCSVEWRAADGAAPAGKGAARAPRPEAGPSLSILPGDAPISAGE